MNNTLHYGGKELNLDTTLAIEKAIVGQIRKDLVQMKLASKNHDHESFIYWENRYVEYSNALASITSPSMFKAYIENVQIEAGEL